MPIIEIPEKENCLINYNENNVTDRALLWHGRFGHASLPYRKALQKIFPENKSLNSVVFDRKISDCEVCLIGKNRLPFISTRNRATAHLQIIHSDVMGPISPSTYPKNYRYISVFIDDYSRLAMVYPIKMKSETGQCLKYFVRSSRNLLGHDAKVCYLRSDARDSIQVGSR